MSTIFQKNFDRISYATWANDQRTEVTVYFNPSGKQSEEIVEMSLMAEAADPDFQLLLKRFSVDEISFFTNQDEEAATAAMHAVVKAYADYNGLVYDPSKEDPKSALNLDMLFDLPDTTQGQDFLFEVKLRAFDVPEISAASQDVKIAIREANTPIKVMYLVGKYLYE